jgi:hypothetical protein
MEGGMKCPYLQKFGPVLCIVDSPPYQPSLFQREEYCETRKYIRCPFLLYTVPSKNLTGMRRGRKRKVLDHASCSGRALDSIVEAE